jgi:hypothetical protein
MYNVRLFRIVTTNPLLYKEYILKKNEEKKKKQKLKASAINLVSLSKEITWGKKKVDRLFFKNMLLGARNGGSYL